MVHIPTAALAFSVRLRGGPRLPRFHNGTARLTTGLTAPGMGGGCLSRWQRSLDWKETFRLPVPSTSLGRSTTPAARLLRLLTTSRETCELYPASPTRQGCVGQGPAVR